MSSVYTCTSSVCVCVCVCVCVRGGFRRDAVVTDVGSVGGAVAAQMVDVVVERCRRQTADGQFERVTINDECVTSRYISMHALHTQHE